MIDNKECVCCNKIGLHFNHYLRTYICEHCGADIPESVYLENYPKGLDSIADKQIKENDMNCQCNEITRVIGRVPLIECVDCGKGYKSRETWENNRTKGGDMKELTVKEAMIHMLNGGECDSSGGVLYRWRDKNDSFISIGDNGNEYLIDFDDLSAELLYIHEKTPELLEGVGKMAINKDNNDIQGIIEHDHEYYWVSIQSDCYPTLDALKKEWHIIG